MQCSTMQNQAVPGNAMAYHGRQCRRQRLPSHASGWRQPTPRWQTKQQLLRQICSGYMIIHWLANLLINIVYFVNISFVSNKFQLFLLSHFLAREYAHNLGARVYVVFVVFARPSARLAWSQPLSHYMNLLTPERTGGR